MGAGGGRHGAVIGRLPRGLGNARTVVLALSGDGRAQMAARDCPEKSIVGYAKAWSPILRRPVEGPVYLAANGGVRPLPDLAADNELVVDALHRGELELCFELLRWEAGRSTPFRRFAVGITSIALGTIDE